MTDVHTLKVVGSAGKAAVELDGVDIADCITGVDLRFRVDDIPCATLNLLLVDVTPVDSEDVEVLIDEKTRDLLVRLGWTPPET